MIDPDREHDDVRFDCAIEAYDFPYSDDDAVPVELPWVRRSSSTDTCCTAPCPTPGHTDAPGSGHHYMSASSLLPCREMPEGMHVGKWDYREIVMVAGTDPYAYKGIPDLFEPHVRPDRDGGCAK